MLSKATEYKVLPHIEYDTDKQTLKYKVTTKIIQKLKIATQVTHKNKLIYTDFALRTKGAWMENY